MNKIKVLVVDDSLVFRNLLVSNLNNDPAIEVVAVAGDAYEARDKIIEFRPDVMTLDIELPKMSGIEFLRKLIPQYPMRVVVISSLSEKVFDAMDAGAVDFVAKPSVADRELLNQFLTQELPVKIKVASTAKIGKIKQTNVVQNSALQSTSKYKDDVLIAIGASTGGTEAIATVLKDFPADIPGTVIVQHMPEGFTSMFANRLNNQCKCTVVEAKHGDVINKGTVYIAPGGNRQMRVIRQANKLVIDLKEGPRVNGHCPSVDVMFESVANICGDRALGVILTGMGGDGAKGLKLMKDHGAHTVGQDESTCIVYGMPKVAYELGGVEIQEKLPNISSKIFYLLSKY